MVVLTCVHIVISAIIIGGHMCMFVKNIWYLVGSVEQLVVVDVGMYFVNEVAKRNVLSIEELSTEQSDVEC